MPAGATTSNPLGAKPDPLQPVEALLAEAERLPAGAAQEAALTRALAAIPPPEAGPGAARTEAYRAEVLSRLSRPREAAAAYARVVGAVLENAEAAHRGLGELLSELGGAAEALELLPRVRARHPGRSWQWDTLEADAKKRLRLDREAPISPEALARLRADVAQRLVAFPCGHDDDRRPLAAAAAGALGLDAPRVLAWLSELGACCCDCAVASVRGPLEPSKR